MAENFNRFNKIKFYLKFGGPAWLVMMADMDASSTLGAAETGVTFKYNLIWFILLLIIPLYIIQELSGRIGIATSKGFGDVIRENYSKRTSVLMSFPMAISDVVTYAIEYIGIAIGLNLIGIPIIVSLPAVYIIHLFVVSKRKYARTERILIPVSFVLILAFIIDLFLRGFIDSNPVYIKFSYSYIFMLAVNVGAVIMPFMLFFQASATADKYKFVRNAFSMANIKNVALKSMRRETFLGAVVSELLMVIVEMVFSGIKYNGSFASAVELSGALDNVAGPFSPYLFGIGLISAGFIALIVISLGSAWGIVESLGIDKKHTFKVYIIESLPAVMAGMILPPSFLINIVLYLLVVFVFVLIGPGIILGIIGINKEIMGNLKLSKANAIAYFFSIAFVIIFGILAII
ncbi:NRAMP (natural resistance-associated macrophage protein) metal ion transporters [Picrophilus oshimae DSM 9789]|uniref:NRAMP (Natural resistance-associated macrophage protein) metal ion transporters n=2 Tax=Picrophilus oshimae TaxID=46632 RepID=A0A8G2FXN2_PICTO|nr:NRAMP (natural resistance-associated macrophage protein) metal ion transporters [Picrophilus oshimae DSM 9789]